jgi:hypothetical protein
VNPFALLSLLIVTGFPPLYAIQARGGITLGGQARRIAGQRSASGAFGGGGMSPAEAAALEAARQEGAAGAGGGGGGLEGLLAALLQGRMGGIGLTSADYGQNLAGLESGFSNYADGSGYDSILSGAYGPVPADTPGAATQQAPVDTGPTVGPSTGTVYPAGWWNPETTPVAPWSQPGDPVSSVSSPTSGELPTRTAAPAISPTSPPPGFKAI